MVRLSIWKSNSGTLTILRKWLRFLFARLSTACDEVKFEQFLACEAFESAVLALVPAPLKYSAARGCDTVVLATVALPGDDTGNFAAAEEFASALLQAWVRSVMALEPKHVARPLRDSMGGAANPEWPWPQMEGLRKSGSH